jgi:hypothetical protein
MGPLGVLEATVIGLLLGGILALALLLRAGPRLRTEVATNLRAALYLRAAPSVARRSRAETVPLAVALAVAAVGVMLYAGGV